MKNTYYCGSYFGYGLHEDAIRSAVDLTRQLGVEPWQQGPPDHQNLLPSGRAEMSHRSSGGAPTGYR